MGESVMDDLLSADDGEDIRDICEEHGLDYEGGSKTQRRFGGNRIDRAEFYEVEFGNSSMYFVVGGLTETEEVPSEEVDGYEGDEETLRMPGNVLVGSVYATTSESEAKQVFGDWTDL